MTKRVALAPHSHSSAYYRFLVVSLSTVLLILCAISLSKLGTRLEQEYGLESLFKLRGTRPAPDNISIIAINSTAAETLNLPSHSARWSRTVYAQIITKLANAGAQLIVVDINFKNTRNNIEDKALEKAIKDAGNVVLVSYLKRQQITTRHGLIDIEQHLLPIERFAQHAQAIGPFILPKLTKQIGHTWLYVHLDKQVLKTQPLAAYALLEPQKINTFTHYLNEPAFINFYGPDRTIPTYDIDTVLRASAIELQSLFFEKITYIGYSEPIQTEQKDSHRTVFSSNNGTDSSGVEISATVLANLLDGSLIRPLHKGWHLGGLALIFCLSCLLCLHLPLFTSLSVQAILFGFFLSLAYWQFNTNNSWWPMVLPGTLIICVNLCIGLVRYKDQKERTALIEGAVSNYLPAQIAAKLSTSIVGMENQHQLVWGVCLISDIRCYTQLSERTPPDTLHRLMNRYYQVLVSEIEQQEGTIGNLVGDSMLALWTGPALSQTMCIKALQAARRIHQTLQVHPELRVLATGFALHGGQFSLGNLGAQGHFEYSPVGDIINTTSRIEPFNRTLNTQLLCSASIYKLIKSTEHAKCLRDVGQFSMHNKSKQHRFYSYDLTPYDDYIEREPLISLFSQALFLFEQHDLPKSLILFEQILETYPDDGPSRYYFKYIDKQINQTSKHLEYS